MADEEAAATGGDASVKWRTCSNSKREVNERFVSTTMTSARAMCAVLAYISSSMVR